MQLINTSLLADANLQAYYRLENVNDSKNSYHLTNNGSVSFVTAKYGLGANFDNPGMKSLSRSDAIGGLINGSNWSFFFWFKMTALENADRSFFLTSVATNKVSTGITYEYNGGTRRLSYFRDRVGPGTVYARYNYTFDTNVYHHIGITYDGTNLLGYLDGAQVASTTQSGNGTNPATDQFTIGINGTTGLYGIVDDFAAFNKTLNLNEIRLLYIDGGAALMAFL